MIGKNRTILIDADDTIVSWRKEFLVYAATLGYTTLPEFKGSYYISKKFNISDEEADSIIISFNEKNTRHFNALDDALDVLPRLANKHGFQFVVISSCMDTPQIVKDRTNNLNELFGNIFTEIHCLPFGTPKTSHLERYESTYWIEDSGNNATLGVQCGHHSILLDRYWNANDDVHPHVKRVTDWHAIEKIILNEE